MFENLQSTNETLDVSTEKEAETSVMLENINSKYMENPIKSRFIFLEHLKQAKLKTM